MSKLLAPNGKPSNLTPEQYKLVRSSAFKKWFGDWENNPANASKIVDENGEPLVVYRGMPKKRRFGNVFKDNVRMFPVSGMSGRQTNTFSFYFTNLKEVASEYGGNFIEDEEEFIVKEYFLNIRNLFKAFSKKNEAYISFKKLYDLATENKDIYLKDHNNNIETDYDGNPIKYYEHIIDSKREYENTNKYNNEKGVFTYFVDWDKHSSNQYFWRNLLERHLNYNGIVFYETTNNSMYDEKSKKNKPKFNNEYSKTYGVFESKNIKLADGTNTTFDGGNPDIRFKDGGEVFNNLSDKSKEIIDANYEGKGSFGFYDFDYNKESERENFGEWLKDFKQNQFKKNLSKVIKQVESDIKLKKEEEKSEIKLKYFEELIIPSLGNEVLIPKLSIYEKQVLLDPNATIESIQKGFIDAKNIIDEDGSINQSKTTPSNFIVDDEINLPAFEKFVEKNPQYKNVFNDWKKILDEYMGLSLQKTYAFRYPSIDDLEYLHSELVELKNKKLKDKFNTGGEVSNTNIITQVWEWFGIKF